MKTKTGKEKSVFQIDSGTLNLIDETAKIGISRSDLA